MVDCYFGRGDLNRGVAGRKFNRLAAGRRRSGKLDHPRDSVIAAAAAGAEDNAIERRRLNR